MKITSIPVPNVEGKSTADAIKQLKRANDRHREIIMQLAAELETLKAAIRSISQSPKK